MDLHLLCGSWCPIVCPPSGALCNIQKVGIPRSVRMLLSDLTNHQRSIRLHVIHLVNQGPIGSPGVVPELSY